MADDARLHELLDLVEQARSEGDKETEAKAIAAYRRESQPAAAVTPPQEFAGAGGFNPMLSRLGGGALQMGQQLGMTPENTANPVANATAPGEAAMQFGSGALAMPVAGLAGIGQGIKNMVVPGGMQAADRVRQVQEAMTYQPRTGAGAGMAQAAGAPMAAYGAGTNYLGGKASEVTGSPLVGAAIKTAGDLAPSLIGAKGVKLPTRGESYKPASDIPATEALQAEKNRLYSASEDAGVVIKPASTAKAADVLKKVADEENVGNMPATIKGAYDTLRRRAENNEPLTLRDADNVRQQISDAFKSKEAADVRLAGKFRDAYDRYLDGLSKEDIKAGDVTQGLEMLKQARSMNRRFAKSQMLDEIENRADIDGQAKYSQAGTEHALRTEFKRIAKDKNEMRKYSPEEQAAIRKVAAPGFAQNVMRGIGKFDPFKGPVAAAGSLGTSGLLAGFLNPIAAALPIAGIGASRLASAMTRGNVNAARATMVGRGLSPPLETLNVRSSAPKPMAGDYIPARPPLALPAPTIISGPRSAPGSAYARQQMGMTPDVELAGMQHPGMARESVKPPPNALPYLPEQPVAKPMVVDPQGRVAPSSTALQDYLQATGQNRLRNVRQPAANPPVSDAVAKIIETAKPKKPRPITQVRADLRQLEGRIRSLSKEDMNDMTKVQALSQEWARLQAELEQSAQRSVMK